MNIKIDEVLRRQLGTFADCGIPAEDPDKKWLRLPCPFCGGDRARISYRLGVFECPHAKCRKRVRTYGENAPAERFKGVIEHAAWWIFRKYTYGADEDGAPISWVPVEEARYAATGFVLNYAYGKRGDANAAGMLDDWEAELCGDELDGRVWGNLKGDLKNYADKKIRYWKRLGTLPDDDLGMSPLVTKTGAVPVASEDYAGAPPSTPNCAVSDECGGDLFGYPLLQMKYGDGLTDAEIAKKIQGKRATKLSAKLAANLVKAEKLRYLKHHGMSDLH